jgi:hypothetical protein
MIQVDLPGLTITNELGQTGPALRDIRNWFDSPEPRVDSDDRSNGDGSFDEGPTMWRARYPTILGEIVSNDPEAVLDLHGTVMDIFANREQFPVTVTTSRGALTCMVRPGGKFEYPIEHEAGIALFTIPLIAADPIKYGAVVTSDTGLPSAGGGLIFNAPSNTDGTFDFGAPADLGRITLTNDGNADTWPIFTVTGYLEQGFFLNCLETGQYLRFDRVVPAGSTVTINSKTWEVLIDGESPWILTRDDFFPVPAKSTRTVQFNAISSGDSNAHLTALVASGNL